MSKVKRELREEFETTVLSTQEDARQGELQPSADGRGRARAAEGHPRAGPRAAHAVWADRIEVEAGFMKMQVSIDDVLEVLPEAGGGSKLPKNVTFKPAPELTPLVQEINVIGERAEEARGARGAVSGSRGHGHGQPRPHRARPRHGNSAKRPSGSCWRKHPHVEKFYQAPQHEGGAGATIVEAKGLIAPRSACPAGFTLLKRSSRSCHPSPITKVVRSMPITFLPYMFFSFHTP